MNPRVKLSTKRDLPRKADLSSPIGPVVNAATEGDPKSKILVLAEAPAFEEIRKGRPLVGAAGSLFNELCHHAGIIRRELYIVNTFPFMVSKNSTSSTIFVQGHPEKILWEKKYGFTDLGWRYAKEAIAKIRASEANVIITLGQTATSVLLPWVKSIQKWRGSVCTTDKQKTGLVRKVVPTYHPAALTWGAPYVWRYDIISDLQKAKTHSEKRALDLEPMDLIIRPTFRDCMDFMRECKRAQMFNTDIELYRPFITCFSLAYNINEAISIPLLNADGSPYWTLDQEIEIWKSYSDLLSDPEIIKVNQNMLFDAWSLYICCNIITRGRMEDPMIMQGIMYPDFPKKLEYITSINTDMEYYKDDKKLWKNFWRDIEAFWRYNAKDSIASFRCLFSLQEDIDKRGWRQQYEDYLEDLPHLLYMMCNGIGVNADNLRKTLEHVQKMLDQKEKELNDLVGYEFNSSSSKQCLNHFYILKDIKPYINIKTKKPTVDDYALQRLWKTHGLKEAKIIQEIRRLTKLKGTYFEVEYDEDNRIRSSYNPAVASTGRLSSTKTVFDTGLDMQNLDPEFKHFIVP